MRRSLETDGQQGPKSPILVRMREMLHQGIAFIGRSVHHPDMANVGLSESRGDRL